MGNYNVLLIFFFHFSLVMIPNVMCYKFLSFFIVISLPCWPVFPLSEIYKITFLCSATQQQ